MHTHTYQIYQKHMEYHVHKLGLMGGWCVCSCFRIMCVCSPTINCHAHNRHAHTNIETLQPHTHLICTKPIVSFCLIVVVFCIQWLLYDINIEFNCISIIWMVLQFFRILSTSVNWSFRIRATPRRPLITLWRRIATVAVVHGNRVVVEGLMRGWAGGWWRDCSDMCVTFRKQTAKCF